MHDELHILRHERNLPAFRNERCVARRRLDQQHIDHSFPLRRIHLSLEISNKTVEERLLDLLVGVDEKLDGESSRTHCLALWNSIEHFQEDWVRELVEQLPVSTVFPT